MTSAYAPKIAIIGGGPGGLTLANILQRNGVACTVYEAAGEPRNQGGTLDLHPRDGQAALAAAGLSAQFEARARPESDCLRVVSNAGEVLWDGSGPDAWVRPESEKFSGRPEIDRAALMEILLEGLGYDPAGAYVGGGGKGGGDDASPAASSSNSGGCIRWGKKVVEISRMGGDKHSIRFAHGEMVDSVDLVVGADGAWSKVRALVSDVKPHYSGISGLELMCRDADARNPWLSSFVGPGNCYSFGHDRTVQMQRLGDGTIRTYACVRKPEGFLAACGIDWDQPDAARRDFVDRYYADCGADVKRALLESSDGLIARELFMLPVGFTWAPHPGATLLGDGAHLMTPFAGVGVNAAMADAMDLARAVTAHAREPKKRTLPHVIRKYETHMQPRGAKYAQKTVGNMTRHFDGTGSEYLAKRLRLVYSNTKKAAIMRKVIFGLQDLFD